MCVGEHDLVTVTHFGEDFEEGGRDERGDAFENHCCGGVEGVLLVLVESCFEEVLDAGCWKIRDLMMFRVAARWRVVGRCHDDGLCETGCCS